MAKTCASARRTSAGTLFATGLAVTVARGLRHFRNRPPATFAQYKFHLPMPQFHPLQRNMTENPTPTANQLVVKPTTPSSASPKPPTTVSQISPQSTQIEIFRDDDYFHENGDLLFVVEDIAFKSVPVGSHVLQDKVEEFRALCWALYAPPQETALPYNPSNFELGRIMDLFLISHKYRLESLQAFATQLLVHHCTPPYTTCRTPELEK
ncbi:hypothetical protein M413DRAFT_28090 [Hebeloma cylindrosporum]|uniref:BTB domain-containing protein n=1 Tax=Hebeloma cylindrosporum TaxID=76867 RepID=A0A0C2YIV7_HEBCY|nr:hypothetical protein M413DRAFT_28090 [Hebeloma cylindrosporum h7]